MFKCDTSALADSAWRVRVVLSLISCQPLTGEIMTLSPTNCHTIKCHTKSANEEWLTYSSSLTLNTFDLKSILSIKAVSCDKNIVIISVGVCQQCKWLNYRKCTLNDVKPKNTLFDVRKYVCWWWLTSQSTLWSFKIRKRKKGKICCRISFRLKSYLCISSCVSGAGSQLAWPLSSVCRCLMSLVWIKWKGLSRLSPSLNLSLYFVGLDRVHCLLS